jgi:hypothetical protein
MKSTDNRNDTTCIHTNESKINTKKKKNVSLCHGFHGLSETLLKFERSETFEIRELCFDDCVCARDNREPLSLGNKFVSS